ncbi:MULTISPECIES: hypothetical protein [Methylomonas]|uniref:Uncharacterized protein n=1 Tax=Methylomonas koyamae TaxID=702114 RepID=A0A177PG44_9GAMM|nr:hypothetical protein [Methylomonas koyamae]OAI28784.1 hypothetical protein A1355_17275 [Methylomonas koyamae]
MRCRKSGASLAALLLLLSACAPQDYFRTDIRAEPCRIGGKAGCDSANLQWHADDGYALGFVEFDDTGRFYDARQAEYVLSWLKAGTEPHYVVIYAHGWHHNASETDFNVGRFKESLKAIKHRHPGYRVTGIYLGWRGETLDAPYLRMLTFWDRRAASAKLGRGPFKDFLLQVERAVKCHPDNRLLTIGHSLGALAIFNALQADWLERVRRQGKGFGDLLLLVNPAIEASRFIALHQAVGELKAPVAANPTAYPSLMVIGSEADKMTGSVFTWSRAFPALFESVLDSFSPLETREASAWELSATAIGHFQPFLTHRLEAGPESADACPALLDDRAEHADRPTWLAGDDLPMPLFDSPGLYLRRLPAESGNGPLWFVQTDKNVLPNHGFLNRKPFWCFVEYSLEKRADQSDTAKLIANETPPRD